MPGRNIQSMEDMEVMEAFHSKLDSQEFTKVIII